MSMGEVTAADRKAAEWNNTKKLMRLYFLQHENVIRWSIALIFISYIFDAVLFLKQCSEKTGYYSFASVFGSEFNDFFWVLLVIIAYLSWDFLSREQISMYPGTPKSRAAARIFFDWILIAVLSAASGVFYLMNAGVFKIAGRIFSDLDIGYAFSARYLGVGVLRNFMLGMLLYAAALVLYGIYTYLDVLKSLILSGCVLFVLAVLCRCRIFWPEDAVRFFTGTDLTVGAFLLHTVLAWLVLMLLVAGMIYMAGRWNLNLGKIHVVAVGIVFVADIVFVGMFTYNSVMFAVSDSSSDEAGISADAMVQKKYRMNLSGADFEIFVTQLMDGEIQEAEYQQKLQEWLESGDLYDESCFMNLSDLSVLSETEAKERGYLSADESVGEDAAVLCLYLPDDTYCGASVYQKYLDSLSFEIVNDVLCYSMTGYRFAINKGLGEAWQMTGEADGLPDDFWEYYIEYAEENLRAFIVLDDQNAASAEKYMEE
ncbi:MAG: hypothetical protein LUH14_01875 [Clostridiaceae bacterium]|nr:hypothetical protein [Clostridiaceae bacterium]